MGNAAQSDTTSIEGVDAKNKDCNEKCNAKSYIEFPLRILSTVKNRDVPIQKLTSHNSAREVYSLMMSQTLNALRQR